MISINLRKRLSRNGDKYYLYLDFYPALFDPRTRKTKKREYLHIFVYAKPANAVEDAYNKKMLELAEAIRCKRNIEIVNLEFGFFDSSTRYEDFLQYFESKAKEHNKSWFYALEKFKEYVMGKCVFDNITVDLVNGFGPWLLGNAKNANVQWRTKYDTVGICKNTAVKYYLILRRVLKDAYRENKLKKDINSYVEDMSYEPTQRQYLTKEEVERLYNTPCVYEPLKDASMFAIYTGLRLSDICSLDWSEIQTAPDGKPCICKRMKKQDREEVVFISEEALRFCGPRKDEGRVFRNFERYMTQKPLQRWLADAGIRKHITFHCFRHTNATLMLAGGADLYTISGQLTHSNIKTTQIYAHLMDESRRNASEIIHLDLDDDEKMKE